MTDRDRLIELLETDLECNKDGHGDCSMCEYEYADNDCIRQISIQTADYLLASGVTVPPCKVGDKLYIITNVSQEIVESVVIGIWLADGVFSLLTIHGTVIADN